MIDQKRKPERLLTGLMVAVAAAYLITFGILNFKGFARFGTGDIYQDVLLMQRIWQEKTLIPQGWHFSNQLYVLAPPTLSALIYGVTGNVNLSCALATTVMGALSIAAFLWMLRAVTGRDRLAMAAGAALLTSYVFNENAANPAYDWDPLVTRISDLGQLLFTTVSHYSTYFIALCLLWGWYLRAAFQHRRGRGMNVLFAVCVVLGFTTGMQSLRQLQIAILPLLGVEVLRLAAASGWFRHGPGKENWAVTAKIALCTLANLAGVAVFYAITPLGGLSSVAVGQEDLARKAVGAYAGCKGAVNLQMPGKWVPGSGVLPLFYYALALAVAVFVVWALTRIPSGLGEAAACCGLFVASLLLTILSMLFTSVGTASRYLFLYWPLAAVAVAWGVTRLPQTGRRVAALLIAAFAVLNFWFSYKPLVTSCFDPEPLPQQQAADWLEKNGFDTVYGQFWTVGPVGLASNGAVEAGHWVFSNFYEISPYLTAEDLYTPRANDHAAYLFTQQDRDRGVQAARKAGVELEFRAQVAEQYYLYTSPVQLMHHTPDAGRDSGY